MPMFGRQLTFPNSRAFQGPDVLDRSHPENLEAAPSIWQLNMPYACFLNEPVSLPYSIHLLHRILGRLNPSGWNQETPILSI